MIIDMGYWSKVLKRLIVFGISIALFCLAMKMVVFFLPFLIAFIIAICVEPLIKKLIKHTKLNRKWSSIVVLFFIFAIIIGGLVWGITSLISEAYNLLQGINTYFDMANNLIQSIVSKFDSSKIKMPDEVLNFFKSSSNDFINTLTEFAKNFLTSIVMVISQIPTIGIYVGITILATYFICCDRIYILDQLEHHLPKTWMKKFSLHLREIITSLGAYLKAQVILVVITFFILLIGLIGFKIYGLNVKYPLLVALGIAFVDALPILGSGTVMLPWAVISGLSGDIKLGISIIVLYIVIIVIRQFMEPRIVSNEIGIHPIFTLIAMYTGFKLIGIMGLLLGPIILIILKSLYGASIDKGIIKAIFDRA